MDLSFKLDAFEGPLDLLLHLIEKNKVSIYDIPIVEITDQYLEYVNAMQEKNLDVVSEFLVMASTLLDIKAKMLLPKQVDENGEEEDPRAELIQKLLEYKMYKYMSFELKDRELDAGRSIYKKPSIPEEVEKYEAPIDYDALLKDVTLDRLNDIFKMIVRRQIDKVDPIRSKFGNIEKEEINLEEKMGSIKEYITKHRTFSFRDMLERQTSKMNVIVSFLAILELMKVGYITTVQDGVDEDILITVCEDKADEINKLELSSVI